MSIIRVMMFVILAACAGSSVLEDAFKKCGRGSLFAIHLLFICLFLNLFHVIPLMFIAAEVLTILVSFSHTSQIANLVPSHVHGGILAIIVSHPPSFQRVSTRFNVFQRGLWTTVTHKIRPHPFGQRSDDATLRISKFDEVCGEDTWTLAMLWAHCCGKCSEVCFIKINWIIYIIYNNNNNNINNNNDNKYL